MSTWAFPRKVATVIKNETGTVVWGFTKAGFIYGVERYAQHVVVGAKLDDVNAWLNAPDEDRGFWVLGDCVSDPDLCWALMTNTGIRMAGHSAMAGTIVASAFPQLPLTFIVGSTALCVAATDLGGSGSENKQQSSWYTTTDAWTGAVACIVYGPSGYMATTSWNVGKFALGYFLTREIAYSFEFGYMKNGVDGHLRDWTNKKMKENGAPQFSGPFDNDAEKMKKHQDNKKPIKDQSAAEVIGEVATNVAVVVGGTFFAGSLNE